MYSSKVLKPHVEKHNEDRHYPLEIALPNGNDIFLFIRDHFHV